MEYLKKFTQHSDYEEFIKGGVSLPNVSYCEKENEVHYNPLIIQPGNEIWYTTIDGNPIEFSKYANSVVYAADIYNNQFTHDSNTYDNGKGIIKFTKNIDWIGPNQNIPFHGISNLETIEFPEGVTILGYRYGLIADCENLKKITIPSTVTSYNAQSGSLLCNSCPNLETILIKSKTIPNMVYYTFGSPQAFDSNSMTNIKQIYVPSDLVETYKNTDGWSTYADKIQAIPE